MDEPSITGYRQVQCGPLRLLYAGGMIRQIHWGRIQVVNAVYAAVRDHNWETVPPRILAETFRRVPDGFEAGVDLEFRFRELLFTAGIEIKGKGNTLSFLFSGTAHSSFLKNRIGICVLHPVESCRGKTARVTRPDGVQKTCRFPDAISPDQPMTEIAGMEWNPAKGLRASLSFRGEVFEMEDQRNWTDNSYKTYGTPLDRPFPVRVDSGTRIEQTVHLTLEGDAPPESGSGIHIAPLLGQESFPLPETGMMESADVPCLSPAQIRALKEIPLSHYRVDLWMDEPGWWEHYREAAIESRRLGWPLEMVLHTGSDPEREVRDFLATRTADPPEIKHIFLFDRNHVSPEPLLERWVPALKKAFPGIPVAGGSDAHFAELNRNRPVTGLLDLITFPVTPQVHASDELTLIENLEAQYDAILSARQLSGLPVAVSALTLKPRFNAVATHRDGEAQGHRPPPPSDPRQFSLFAAGWTMGSIWQLARAGTLSVTCFETTGARGVLRDEDPPLTFTPVWYLLKEILGEGNNGPASAKGTHTLQMTALLLVGTRPQKLLLANHTVGDLEITLAGLPGVVSAVERLTEAGWIPDNSHPFPVTTVTLLPYGISKIHLSS